mgnify:CR=1 FL=1
MAPQIPHLKLTGTLFCLAPSVVTVLIGACIDKHNVEKTQYPKPDDNFDLDIDNMNDFKICKKKN